MLRDGCDLRSHVCVQWIEYVTHTVRDVYTTTLTHSLWHAHTLSHTCNRWWGDYTALWLWFQKSSVRSIHSVRDSYSSWHACHNTQPLSNTLSHPRWWGNYAASWCWFQELFVRSKLEFVTHTLRDMYTTTYSCIFAHILSLLSHIPTGATLWLWCQKSFVYSIYRVRDSYISWRVPHNVLIRSLARTHSITHTLLHTRKRWWGNYAASWWWCQTSFAYWIYGVRDSCISWRIHHNILIHSLSHTLSLAHMYPLVRRLCCIMVLISDVMGSPLAKSCT